MKRGIDTGIVIFALSLATTALANANDSDAGNPYHAIIERNVFDLKAPPPPPSANTTSNAPPPNVKLTGITSILGTKRALFMVQEPSPPGKPQNKEQSYIMTEGQKQGVLELLEINEKARTVKVRNDGVVSTLTFEVKLPSAPPGGQPTGLAGGGAGGIPRPPGMPVPPGPTGGYNPRAAIGGAQPGANNQNMGGLSNIPTRTMRTTPQNYSAEEAVLINEGNRIANQQLIDAGKMPPLPPPPPGFNPGGNGAVAPPGLPNQ